MWNIRMRAAKRSFQFPVPSAKVKNKNNFKSRTLNSEHISGAEGIYKESEISKICKEYIKRALTHPRGKSDEIVITIEKISQKPRMIPLLPVKTLRCSSPHDAEMIITRRFSDCGVSLKAINNGLKVIRSKKTMRGASLILMKSGGRVEPDRVRGVRVSRMGITKTAERKLSRMLSGIKLNITTVKEALILASKVASCPAVIAEVCISDDPDYTTGYVASRKFGYLRIPNIKNYGEMHGGRVFFVRGDKNINTVINYLERKPVIIRCL